MVISCLLVPPPLVNVKVLSLRVPVPTAKVFGAVPLDVLGIVIVPLTFKVIPGFIFSMTSSLRPVGKVIDAREGGLTFTLTVVVLLPITANTTTSPDCGTPLGFQLFASPQLSVPAPRSHVFVASPKKVTVCSMEVCPSAVASSNEPTQSSSHTCQVVVKFPSASAVTIHG